MSMRPVAAVFAVAMIALVCSTLARAQDSNGMCVAKDQVIEKVMTESGEGTYFRKVTGGGAQALGADMEAHGLSDIGTSYVVFWKDGEDKNVALIAIFDEHNCFDRLVKGPKEEVLKITSGTGV